jgi:leucyl/phenylalanyl-tRNA--protein transferase
MEVITAEMVLNAYAGGMFPMADDAGSDELLWYMPEMRGVIPLDEFHVSKRLSRVVRSGIFEVRINTQFRRVMEECARQTEGRDCTWINTRIIDLYTELHEYGFGHSVECYVEDELVGGLYGLALGGAFFGESMFSRKADASKVTLVHLIRELRNKNYKLLDTQYINDHLLQFGAKEIAKEEYLRQLGDALMQPNVKWL